MQHLLEYLNSEEKAAGYFRQLRWSEGVCCLHCGNHAIKAPWNSPDKTGHLYEDNRWHRKLSMLLEGVP